MPVLDKMIQYQATRKSPLELLKDRRREVASDKMAKQQHQTAMQVAQLQIRKYQQEAKDKQDMKDFAANLDPTMPAHQIAMEAALQGHFKMSERFSTIATNKNTRDNNKSLQRYRDDIQTPYTRAQTNKLQQETIDLKQEALLNKQMIQHIAKGKEMGLTDGQISKQMEEWAIRTGKPKVARDWQIYSFYKLQEKENASAAELKKAIEDARSIVVSPDAIEEQKEIAKRFLMRYGEDVPGEGEGYQVQSPEAKQVVDKQFAETVGNKELAAVMASTINTGQKQDVARTDTAQHESMSSREAADLQAQEDVAVIFGREIEEDGAVSGDTIENFVEIRDLYTKVAKEHGIDKAKEYIRTNFTVVDDLGNDIILPIMHTREDARKLTPGTRFVTPDGEELTR